MTENIDNINVNEEDIVATDLSDEQLSEISGGKVAAGGVRQKLPAKAGYIVHQITATDTLIRIANKYHTTVKAIKACNPSIKDVRLIRTGYYIYVPKG